MLCFEKPLEYSTKNILQLNLHKAAKICWFGSVHVCPVTAQPEDENAHHTETPQVKKHFLSDHARLCDSSLKV